MSPIASPIGACARILDGVTVADQPATLPELDPDRTAWPGEYVELERLKLHVRTTPGPDSSAEDAVYVHGLGGSATNWTDLAAALADEVHGHAIDLPGFGRTEPPRDWPYTPEAQAEVLAEYIETLGGRPVHLFGNSLGGATAVLLAASRPDLVRTLTLISPAVPDRRPDPRRLSDPRLLLADLPVIGKTVRRRMAGMSARQRAMLLLRLVFANPDGLPEARVDEFVREASERAEQPWARAALTNAGLGMFRLWLRPGRRSLWSALREVRAPTLVVWGRQDKLVTVRKARPTVRALRRGRLLVLEHAGHVAQMEQPKTVASATLSMWDAVAAGTW